MNPQSERTSELDPGVLGEDTISGTAPTVALITGGAGFVGSHLVRNLLGEGQLVVVYDDLSSGSISKLPLDHPNLTFVQGDILDQQHLRRVFTDFRPQSIWHLAALHFIPYCNAHPDETIGVNILGTQCVLECCAEFQVDELIYTSTAGVYPITGESFSEDEPTEPHAVYGITKRAGEMLVTHFQKTTGIRCIIARLFNVYGPGETNPHVIPEILDQVREGGTIRLGNTSPKRDFVHVEDVVGALWSLRQARSTVSGIYNVGTGTEHSVAEIVELIGRIVQKPLQVETVPERVRRVDRLHLRANISKIKRDTGWEPALDLHAGLNQLIWEEAQIVHDRDA